jgi:cytochrome c
MTRARVRAGALLPLLVIMAACGGEGEAGRQVTGNVENGRLLLQQYGCGSCHAIPGVANARGNVGPTLAGVGRRVYIGGFLPNTPENMARWIVSPRAIDPLTAMPDLQVPALHASDMVAYLYSAR